MKYTEKHRELFTVPAEALAPWLLGKIICHRSEDENGEFVVRGRIMVTEAYRDCDEDNGLTDNSREKENGGTVQSKAGGHLYIAKVDRTGGVRIDIVANKQNVGEGVLIRKVDSYVEGPCVAAWAMNINDDTLNGVDLLNSKDIWIESDCAEIIPSSPALRKNLGSTASDEAKAAALRFSVREIKFA